LNSLRSIDLATAEALADHEGLLALNGLEAPEEGVIVALARHRGHLCLNGLATLSPTAADTLATRRGKASLHGLTSLNYQSLQSLFRLGDQTGVDLPDWIPTGRRSGLAPEPAHGRGEGRGTTPLLPPGFALVTID
jgi:hypothetical protein